MKTKDDELQRKFWAKIDKQDSGCWLWQGQLDTKDTAGILHVFGNYRCAHRLMWQLTKGDIPSRAYVLPNCGTRLCVNPDHLEITTSRYQTNSKKILELVDAGRNQKEIAEEVGASREAVHNVIQFHRPEVFSNKVAVIEERRKKALELFRSGLSITQIGVRLQAAPSVIHYYIKKAGLNTRANYKAKASIIKDGYRLLHRPGHRLAKKNYVREHVLVAETKLGRELKKGEIVHHVNGDKLDNRPENLYVCKDNREHMLIHWTIAKVGLQDPALCQQVISAIASAN